MKCPHCQSELPENSKFCGVCGQSLITEWKCSKCGHINPKGYKFCLQCGQPLKKQVPTASKTQPPKPPTIEPTSFAGGRYQVKKFLGEGGKKKVYLAHDMLLKRDNAFAPTKTEKPDDAKYGVPDGKPVFYVHDNPFSRLEGRRLDECEQGKDIIARIIAIDRPGLGLSDFKVNQRLFCIQSNAGFAAAALVTVRYRQSTSEIIL